MIFWILHCTVTYFASLRHFALSEQTVHISYLFPVLALALLMPLEVPIQQLLVAASRLVYACESQIGDDLHHDRVCWKKAAVSCTAAWALVLGLLPRGNAFLAK